MFPRFDDRILQGLESGKWLAILLMALCHSGMAVGGDLTWPAFWIGRFCAPAFCFIIVARLAEKPERRAPRYLARLTAWSIPAQLPYSLWLAPFGFHFNVLVTLALGVGAIWIWLKGYRALAVLFAAAWLGAALWFDMGLIAPPAILLGYVLFQRSAALAAFSIAAFYAAGHLYGHPHDLVAPVLCLLMPAIFVLCGLFSRLPRLPGWVFYAFYPTHIGLLYLLFGPLEMPK